VRQGDTISPVLFILVIETLAINIRADGTCIGIKISSKIFIRILLFADDVCLLASDEYSLALMLDHVNEYKNVNTGKINQSKCCIIPLNLSNLEQVLLGIPVISPLAHERYLGYEFHFDRSRTSIDSALKKFESRLICWKNLHLSIFGKATVLRTYALPLLYYVTAIDSLTNDEEKKIKNLTSWFLFSYEDKFLPQKNYRSRLSESRLVQTLGKGGLNIVPIAVHSNAQKVHWAIRVFQGKSSDGWVYSFKELLQASRNPSWDIPIEMSMSTPQQLLLEDKRITIKKILLSWFETSKMFNSETAAFVGSWGKKNSIISIYKVVRSRNGVATLLETTNRKGSITIIDSETTRPLNYLVPVCVKAVQGKLEFHGPHKKRKLFKQGQLRNGIPILKASFKSIVQNICCSGTHLTEKQSEWAQKFPGSDSNFSLLLATPLRTCVKSHVFSRFSNSLPRLREEVCPRCHGSRESSDHVLCECPSLIQDAKTSIKCISSFFGLSLSTTEFLTVLNPDLRIRIFQMISLYCSWQWRCKMRHGEAASRSSWECSFSSEIKGVLLKLMNSGPLHEFTQRWEPLLKTFDPETLELDLNPLFGHRGS
jgi:hypothetical protein